MGHTMAVKEFSGPKWVIRLPDSKTLSDEAKEYLDEQFRDRPTELSYAHLRQPSHGLKKQPKWTTDNQHQQSG